jgi:S1-C subfamily serine protease
LVTTHHTAETDAFVKNLQIDPSSVVSLSSHVWREGLLSSPRTGTGFLISPTGCFLATYHQYAYMLKEGGQPVAWKFTEVPAIPLKILPEKDLVLFKLTGGFSNLPFLHLPKSHYQLQPGEQVLVLGGISGPKVLEAGNPTAGYTPVNDRVVYEKQVDLWAYQLFGRLQKGDSGSPVISTRGEAIGIAFANYGEFVSVVPISKDLLFPRPEELAQCK